MENGNSELQAPSLELEIFRSMNFFYFLFFVAFFYFLFLFFYASI